MRQPDRRFRMADTTLLAGWLFADLLLALAVIFLAANTIGYKPIAIATPAPTVTVVPTPSPTVVLPTPTPTPPLELSKHRLVLPIDSNGLLNNSPAAINALKQEVRAQTALHGRIAGLAIVYGGAPDPSLVVRAQNIAAKVITVLQSLGQEGFVFLRTSYYDPLYILYGTDTVTTIDVYLFAI
jgi:hypothetical protein